MYDKIMIMLLVILLGIDFIITNRTMRALYKEVEDLKFSKADRSELREVLNEKE